MSVLVLLPGEGKAVQIGGGGLGVVFKLFGIDTGGQFAVVKHLSPVAASQHRKVAGSLPNRRSG